MSKSERAALITARGIAKAGGGPIDFQKKREEKDIKDRTFQIEGQDFIRNKGSLSIKEEDDFKQKEMKENNHFQGLEVGKKFLAPHPKTGQLIPWTITSNHLARKPELPSPEWSTFKEKLPIKHTITYKGHEFTPQISVQYGKPGVGDFLLTSMTAENFRNRGYKTLDPIRSVKAGGGSVQNNDKFKKWFGKSVTHTNGVPHVFYTGTSKDKDFPSFNVGRHGVWFTRDPAEASRYAEENDSQGFTRDDSPGASPWAMKRTNTASRVISVHIKAENPYTGEIPQEVLRDNYKHAQSSWFDKLRAAGHDSWMPASAKGNLIAVLKEPQQIKSVYNSGEFDPNDKRMNKNSGGAVLSDAQKEAGNYKKQHLNIQGLNISIENAKGSIRSGTGKNGHKWSVKMPADYGYIKGTSGADGDHVDVYVGPDHNSNSVFIVDQKDHTNGKFDEHKCMIGFRSLNEAVETYKAGFSDGKGSDRLGHIARLTMSEFKDWLKNHNTTKPIVKQHLIDKALSVAKSAQRSA